MFISFLFCLFFFIIIQVSHLEMHHAPQKLDLSFLENSVGGGCNQHVLKHILLLYNDYALDSSFWALTQMQRQVEPVEEIKWGLEMSWQPYLSIFLLGVNNHLTADLFT